MNTRIAKFAAIAAAALSAVLGLSSPADAQGRPSIATLQAQIATLQANDIPELATYLSVDSSNPTRPRVRVSGADLQVVNGSGTTDAINGRGNLIVGYDEARPDNDTDNVFFCSLGEYTTSNDCTSNGGVWDFNFKGGSHNIIVGAAHAYSRHSGIVSGYFNTITGVGAGVTGGRFNSASGPNATVSGGLSNTASGEVASVSGGQSNTASGFYTSISGGIVNQAAGNSTSITGGTNNLATGTGASISGGHGNQATAETASVSGGDQNSATGIASSVSGGHTRSAADQWSWAAGSLKESN